MQQLQSREQLKTDLIQNDIYLLIINNDDI